MRTAFTLQSKASAKRITQNLLLISILLLFIPTITHAGKLFKWVDENGVTHFGSTPPPQQSKKNKVAVEDLSTSNSKKQGASSTQRVRGEWWAKKNARVTQRLKLSYDSFELSENVSSNYGVRKKVIASGRYKLKNDAIELTYFEHQGNPEKLDQTDLFEIVHLEDTKMTLLQGFTNKQFFKRKQRTSSTDFSRKIKGEWVGPKNRKYKFEHGTFLTYREGNTRSRAFGNWHWQDPELTLDFVADFGHPIDNEMGRMERWVITERSYQEIIFVDQNSGKTQTLKRVR